MAVTPQLDQCRMAEQSALIETLGIALDELNPTANETGAEGAFARGTAIAPAIEQMIERNLLRRSNGARPLLSLTQHGAVILAQNVVQ
jgi:hypothetical protein